MKIAFLGTSCAEPIADNGYTSFLVESGGLLLLIDASGNPVQSMQKAQVDPLDLDLVVLTHYHADHIGGYPSLIQTLSCMGRKREMLVVASETTRARVRELHRVLELDPPNTAFPVKLRDDFSGPDLGIRLVPGSHSVPTSMVLMHSSGSRLLYTSDTIYSPQVSEAARGCGTLIHEATFGHSRLNEPGHDGHSSAYQAGLAAARAGVERLILCHICWHKYPRPAAVPEEAGSAFRGEIILPEPFRWYML